MKENKNKNFKNQSFFLSTFLIIIVSFIVKLLGLLNKIIITRVLGTKGMSLYVLSFPTIMLFVSISGMSLYLTISKLVAEGMVNQKYSPKKILKKAIKLSLMLSIFVDIIYIIILKPLTIYFLKNESLFYPLLTGALLIPLVGISDGLKGYFNGIKKTNIASMGNLTEQIARISFSIFFLYLMIPKGVIIATTFCLLALSFGELISIIYSLLKIKKYPPLNFEKTTGETKAILEISVPTTFSRLLGNFTYFLEPILYTMVLTSLGYLVTDIHQEYTIIDAYTIPLLTFCSFIPFAISSTIVPGISSSIAKGKRKSIEYYVQKALLFSLIPSIFLLLNLYYYSDNYMVLLYKTTEGSHYVKKLTIFFACYYMHIPIVSILQAIGKTKTIFITSTINNFLRLLLIIILSFIKIIGIKSVLIATTMAMVIGFLIDFIQLLRYTTYKPNKKNILNLLLITIITFMIITILNFFKLNYLTVLFISGIVYFGFAIYYKLFWIESIFEKINLFKKKQKN